VNAIRAANRELKAHHLLDAMVATTCEPCPMCMAALHWARVREVYYGATIADATKAGFNEIDLSAATVNRAGGNKVQLSSGVLTGECQQLFHDWGQRGDRATY
jgi:guanine deaminase